MRFCFASQDNSKPTFATVTSAVTLYTQHPTVHLDLLALHSIFHTRRWAFEKCYHSKENFSFFLKILQKATFRKCDEHVSQALQNPNFLFLHHPLLYRNNEHKKFNYPWGMGHSKPWVRLNPARGPRRGIAVRQFSPLRRREGPLPLPPTSPLTPSGQKVRVLRSFLLLPFFPESACEGSFVKKQPLY